MECEFIHIKNMILIGATGQNSGKTTFANELIQRWHQEIPIIALKITTVNQKHAHCVRGGAGCGACSSLFGEFELTEETNPDSGKDTSLLLAAGANRVYWLKCMKDHLGEAIQQFLTTIPEDALVLCESNSLRNVVRPGLFVMLQNSSDLRIKPSAEEVLSKADLMIINHFEDDIKDHVSQIQIQRGVSGLEIELLQTI
ncbi:hypothetical protein FRZ06_01515 [Anoxybacterium hadale]|uniref:Uncharacterized protein n=1 Tax=Anoxybacterium hadale TaxID=3408580 RepID=A0ACD1A6V0_9FIRM|nr:hypothetical protein FRZ06_01515 [Clostridiales bacterium]